MRHILAVALSALIAAPAFGQSAGTLALTGPSTTPGAPQLTPAAINTAVNAILSAKQDYNAPGLFTTLTASGNATVGATLFITGSGGFATIDPGGSTLVLKSNGSSGLVKSLAPFTAPSVAMTNGTVTTGAVAGLYMNNSLSGTSTSFPAIVHLLQSNDAVTDTNGLSYLDLSHSLGGSTMTGGRNTLDIQTSLNSITGNAGGTLFSAVRITASSFVNDHGTAVSISNPSAAKGALWSINNVVQLGPSATNWSGLTGQELDVGAQAGSSVLDKIGFHIVQLSNDAVQGVRDDVAIDLNNQGSYPAQPGWRYGIGFGRGGGMWPIAPSGTLIGIINTTVPGGVASYAATNGVDFRLGNFSGAAYASPGFQVSGAGSASVGAAVLTPTTTGITMDVQLAQVSSVAILSGGTSYAVGYVVNGPNGGLYQVSSVSSGVVTGLTILVPDYDPPGSTPANPVTLLGSRGSQTLTVNFTWTTATTLSLQPSGGALKGGSGMFTASGSVATTMTSLGPPGSHTTVQEWLTITDASGTVRYIPAY